MSLIYELAFRKSDGTPYEPIDKEKKAMLLFRGGDDMRDLFHHVGKVKDTDSYTNYINNICNGHRERKHNTGTATY